MHRFVRCFIPALTSISGSAQAASKPNVVLILMDNYGWGEPGVYGGGIQRGAPSPNIDQLAAEIMRLLSLLARRYMKHPADLEDYFWLSRLSTVGARL